MKNKPVCYVPSYEHPEVFSGVPSFLGLPVAKTEQELKGNDFAIMGVPWEGVCTYGGFTGVENATKTIRKASERYGGYMPELDFDLFDHFSGCDFGDCAVRNGDREFTFRSVEAAMASVVNAGCTPITFGGDHSLSYPLIKAFAEKYDGNIGVIHFDAHMDNMDAYGDEAFARCCPFHRVYELPGFRPENMVSVGIRGPRNNFAAVKEARKYGASVITSFDVKHNGFAECIERAIAIAKKDTRAFYVSVCSDALDIACNPGGPADPCGLTSYELAEMLLACGKAGAGAFDFMEIYPPDDLHNVSSHVACWMALYMMNGMAMHRLAQR